MDLDATAGDSSDRRGSDRGPRMDAAARLDVATGGDARTVADGNMDARSVDARSSLDARRDSSPQVDAAPPLRNPYLPRVENETCRLPEPPPVGQYDFEPVFSALRFQRPLWIGVAPGDPDTLFVLEQAGQISAFENDPDVADKSVFLDLTVSRSGNEEGLLGMAFHPDYAANGRFYVYYSAGRALCNGARRCSIVSEFTRAERRRADPASERRLMTIPQPFSNHNGGDMHFGPDGYLYISLGDGGSAGDPQGNGQNTNSLLGSILRIDVDGMGIEPYVIPPTNPFVNGGGRPEVWAWGLRNVWRMAFDRRTGVLWASDVGQNAYEEIHRITGPGNFGWKIREGFECYNARNCESEGLIPPVHAYDHGQGESITGGVVYRGGRLPELWGKYLFADYDTARVWVIDTDGDGPRDSQLIGTQARVTSFGEDAVGRVYMTTFINGQSIVRLRRRAAVEPVEFPQRLSQTGCFADVPNHVVAPGVLPYAVNLPFWSDGLEKSRFVAFPPGERAEFRAQGSFGMPVGTVLIKTFSTPAFGGTPARRIETRMWTRLASGWRGFTWKWNNEQTDAVLVDGRENVAVNVGGEQRQWLLPSRTDCERCHTEAAGYTLGWAARQLHGVFSINGDRVDQLRALAAAGYLVIPDGAELVAHPRPGDEAVPLTTRARAVLHVNCANCHQPGGFANAQIDLRLQTDLARTGVCAEPGQGDLGIQNARIVAAGSSERSVLLQRMNRRDGKGMPPFGSNVPNTEAVDIVRAWIDGLEACPEGNP